MNTFLIITCLLLISVAGLIAIKVLFLAYKDKFKYTIKIQNYLLIGYACLVIETILKPYAG